DAQALAEWTEDVLLRHEHVAEAQPRRGRAANTALRHPRLDHLEALHFRCYEEGRDLRVLRTGDGGARHHCQHLRDGTVRDVAFLTIEDVTLAIGCRHG